MRRTHTRSLAAPFCGPRYTRTGGIRCASLTGTSGTSPLGRSTNGEENWGERGTSNDSKIDMEFKSGLHWFHQKS
jgi:hypothetical protein